MQTKTPVQKHVIHLHAGAGRNPKDTVKIEVRPIWGEGGTGATGRYKVLTFTRCGWQYSPSILDRNYSTDNLPDFDTAVSVATATADRIRAEGWAS